MVFSYLFCSDRTENNRKISRHTERGRDPDHSSIKVKGVIINYKPPGGAPRTTGGHQTAKYYPPEI